MPEAEIILASASPRRRELLGQIGVAHEVLPVDVDETPREEEAPETFACRLALEKALAGWLLSGERRPVLGADTVVVIDQAIMGKPRDKAHALAMWSRLSNASHRVLSAVAVVQGERQAVRLSESRVSFRELTAAELDAYWASGEPVGKAGAYAIQGLGAVFVQRLEGSYSGVMGLPLFETAELLKEFGVHLMP